MRIKQNEKETEMNVNQFKINYNKMSHDIHFL